MSEEGHGPDKGRPEWVNDAEEALDTAGKALKSAWQASREARMAALSAAKQAANQLGQAIEQGVAAFKDTSEPRDESATSADPFEPTQPPPVEAPRVDAEVEATGLPPDEEE